MPLIFTPPEPEMVDHIRIEIGEEWTETRFSKPIPRKDALARLAEMFRAMTTDATPPIRPNR